MELGTAIDAAALHAAWNEALYTRMQEGIPLRLGAGHFLDALDRMHLPRAVATNGVTARAEWKLEQTDLPGRIDAIVGIGRPPILAAAPFLLVMAGLRVSLWIGLPYVSTTFVIS